MPRPPLAVGTLLLQLLLAAPAAAQSTAQSVVTERYELYAPTPAALARAREELDYAVARFRRYVGEDAPKIAVVVADSPAALVDMEPRYRFAQRGILALGWLTADALAGAARPVSVMEELGLVLVAASAGGARVASILPRADGGALRVDDVIRTIDGARVTSPEEALARYHLALDDTVSVGIVRDGRALTLRVPAWRRAGAASGAAGAVPASRGSSSVAQARVLSHEACHLLLIAWADARLGTRSAAPLAGSISGHQRLPDWFDEAMATLCEYPALQQSRYALLRSRGARIALASLFTMPHPVLAELNAVMADSATSTGPSPVVVVRLSSSNPGVNIGPVFYAESLAFAEFLAEREGPTVVGRVARALLDGRTMPEILHSDATSLERDWKAWLARQ